MEFKDSIREDAQMFMADAVSKICNHLKDFYAQEFKSTVKAKHCKSLKKFTKKLKKHVYYEFIRVDNKGFDELYDFEIELLFRKIRLNFLDELPVPEDEINQYFSSPLSSSSFSSSNSSNSSVEDLDDEENENIKRKKIKC